jgi:Uma2 family endonuclease
VPSEEIQRLRMSWEEYLELPERPRTEWVDGEVLVMPPVAQPHGYVVGRLIRLLGNTFPHLEVGTDIGVWLPRNRLRGPDVIVTERMTAETWVTEPPILVAEVLSRSTRSEDTVRKSMEYAEGGIGQYWIVDPDLRTIEVLANHAGAWDVLAHLDDHHPSAEIAVAEHGTVPLDLSAVLGRQPA